MTHDLGHGQQDSQLTGHARVGGHSLLRFPVLTIGLLGMQIFWSVEQAYGSPYLLSLGLSKSAMAMVFLAGPASSLIVQPLVGVLSDNCTSRFGRRRPYIIGGACIAVSGMLLLGHAREVGGMFSSNNTFTLFLAVFAVFVVDFSTQIVVTVAYALLVEVLPASDQATVNAWSARMGAIGGVVGFWIGTLDLPTLLPALGPNELSALSVISSFLLLAGYSTTAILVHEQVLVKHIPRSTFKEVIDQFRGLLANYETLPSAIKQIFIIQFLSWMGWFPVWFYTTVFVGDAYKRQILADPATPFDAAAIEDEATRVGAHALLYSALLSLSCNFVLPLLTKNPDGSEAKSWKIGQTELWVVGMGVFSTSMFATFFTDSLIGSTLIMSALGFSGAIAFWVPFSLIGAMIAGSSATSSHPGEDVVMTEVRRSRPSESAETLLVGGHARDDEASILSGSEDGEEVREDLSARTGIILGLHNIFTVLPQFVMTGMASIVFALTDYAPPSDVSVVANAREEMLEAASKNAVVYVFRLGGASTMIAAILCYRLARELRAQKV
ncbi:MFS general substrate transporter [Cylindrobasidium torrendii FP15055 ss-10]|uniref:MFS general substrate transporter n=1 Tax=Cylindrobasidium torrendii FP15055 ss-10 TaxID=1314674 RepID=A0A0D7B3J5_9AGAR|nr:MFS general substrate transporter [Cylindrobasidium torrendii FP15055 ss-10]